VLENEHEPGVCHWAYPEDDELRAAELGYINGLSGLNAEIVRLHADRQAQLFELYGVTGMGYQADWTGAPVRWRYHRGDEDVTDEVEAAEQSAPGRRRGADG
jgi:hypothetical protein